MNLVSLDQNILRFFHRISFSLMRLAIAIVYVWFGGLKLFHLSPADQLVSAMQSQTLPFFSSDSFLVFLGLFELLVGLLFLFPKVTRLAILLLILHMITTFLPLIFLIDMTWNGFLQPTLTGQYIVKNIIILALAMAIGSSLKPIGRNSSRRVGK